MTRRSLSTSSNAPDSAATSTATAVTEPSDVVRETTLVSAALDSTTPAALLTEAINVEQAPRPLSVFDLMRIGVGPSSSYTMGPIRADRAFSQTLAEAVHPGGAEDSDGKCASLAPGAGLLQPNRITAEFYGSLGATGRGRAIDRAAVVGLAGYEPETVPAVVYESLVEEVEAAGELVVDGVGPIPFSPNADIYLLSGWVLPYHINGMTLTTYCASGAEILRRTYYSVGGDFIVEDVDTPGSPSIQALATTSTTQTHTIPTPFPFTTSVAILATCERESLSVSDVVLASELSARNREEIMTHLDRLHATMRTCIEAGMNVEDVPPGGLGMRRRVKALHERLHVRLTGPAAAFTMASPLHDIDWVDLLALTINEEDAAGRRIVTAPTNGTAGIAPAVLVYYERFIPGADDGGTRHFLLTATAMGRLIKTDASTAGVEVGCQEGVDSISPMVATGLTEVLGGTPAQVENAVEIVMEHNLGLICNPVGELAQIPRIEHNAVATIEAINAAHMALWGEGRHAVSLDTIIETMHQTGEDMLTKHEETSRSDLAVDVVECWSPSEAMGSLKGVSMMSARFGIADVWANRKQPPAAGAIALRNYAR